ncbi:hypothetical protein LX32DRAFT_12726 [Colletotrichum zoysiae]|uniref:Transmembrane protein n=1 Tax=Colletotrichum zoysiae TaxID=1216348 RepID=A0AAD9HDA7_9PEZI|nr:hypothetical protein LX32DRAFT_12726 [Colletotrichum zoysiae]
MGRDGTPNVRRCRLRERICLEMSTDRQPRALTQCLEADEVRQRARVEWEDERQGSETEREREREREKRRTYLGTAAYACAVCVYLIVCATVRAMPGSSFGLPWVVKSSRSRERFGIVGCRGVVVVVVVSVCRSVCLVWSGQVWSGLAWQWGAHWADWAGWLVEGKEC